MKNIKVVALSALMTTVVLISACSSKPASVDLDRVLDVTANTLETFESRAKSDYGFDSETNDSNTDIAMQDFVKELQTNLNQANPKIHADTIGVNLADDGSIHGYNDMNNNGTKDSGEIELFKVEIDSEKNRLIASSENYVRDHRFSGTGLLAGFLLGNMLGRQRSAGINPKSLSSKTAMSSSAYKSARSRSGSGSHSRGK